MSVALLLLAWTTTCSFGLTNDSAVSTRKFAGSLSCRQCHEKFYELWAPSLHGLAMQPYTNKLGEEKLVLHDEYIEGMGKSFRAIITKQKAYICVKSGDTAKNYPIMHVLGGKNVYYFLTLLERGRLQVLPLAFDVRRKEWFDTTASAVRHFAGERDEAIDWMETLELVHPDTWWPIEQNYYVDGYAFRIDSPKPPRIDLMTGKQQKGGFVEKTKNSTIQIKGGAATVLDLPLDPSKELERLSLEALCNDVVIGLMSVTLAK